MNRLASQRKWIRYAAEYRENYPLCIGCYAIGLEVPTEVVDHIVPHLQSDVELMWDENNLQPACKWHHDSVKAELERRYKRGQIGPGELYLNSKTAIALTRRWRKVEIGLDGWPVAGT
jgi:5-methylcytosine-specific restriction endonuclease McrA